MSLFGNAHLRVIVETADSLTAPWVVTTVFQLNRPGQEWSVPIEIQQSGRFFRVRVETGP